MSDICRCYKKYDMPRYGCGGYCIGTKECEPCTCQGKESMCDFYPEKRSKAIGEEKMNTAEMWLKAQVNGKVYRSNDVGYSKNTGFIDFWDGSKWPVTCVDTIDAIFSWDNWEEVKTITKAQAEAKLGMKIVE